MMGGYGPAYGMGHWMMGGYGSGYGMAPGMMGGYGPGHGMAPAMMGGFGPGVDAIGTSLTPEQRKRMAAIQQEFAQRQWPLMQQMHQLMWADAGADDETQERSNYDAVARLHRQLFESSLLARRQMEEVLTPEQREQLRRSRQAWRPGGAG